MSAALYLLGKALRHPELVEGSDTGCPSASSDGSRLMPTGAASGRVSGPSTPLRSAQDDGRLSSVNLEIPLIPSWFPLEGQP